MLKVSYLQLDATGSLDKIPASAYATLDIIVFAFADVTKPDINENYLSRMQTAMTNAKDTAQFFLSIGGQLSGADQISLDKVDSIVANLENQIDAYNQRLTKPITGVDLDLEARIDNDTTLALAEQLSKSFVISVAPQVYIASGSNIDSSKPSNMVLTSGGSLDTYSQAIKAGYVAYIFSQLYNSGNFTIDGHAETDVKVFKAFNTAMENFASLNGFPSETKKIVGLPANQGAGGVVTLFNPSGQTIPQHYDQASILNELNGQIKALGSSLDGVMMWSLNNDYFPSAWNGDTYAQAGAFSNAIFGAAPVPVPQDVYFILQVSNTGSKNCISATLVVNGSYYPFGSQAGKPIAPGAHQMWGTSASSKNTPNVIDSWNLDQLFKEGVASIQANVILNFYASDSQALDKPDHQKNVGVYVFESGKTYNLMINADTQAYEITKS